MLVSLEYPNLSVQTIEDNIKSFKDSIEPLTDLWSLNPSFENCIEKVAKMGHRLVQYNRSAVHLNIDTECSGNRHFSNLYEAFNHCSSSCRMKGRISIDLANNDFKLESVDLCHEQEVCGAYTFRERPSTGIRVVTDVARL